MIAEHHGLFIVMDINTHTHTHIYIYLQIYYSSFGRCKIIHLKGSLFLTSMELIILLVNS
jgi:hypothetical protein